MTLHQWKAAGKFLEFRGHQIFYQDAASDKPCLLLIHGFPTASWDWHRIWSPLRERYRLLAPDMIGFGFSDKPRRFNYTIADQADLLEALVAKAEVKKTHILAHDYGDTVAQELLARQQSGKLRFGILSVALLNGGLFPDTYRPRFIQKLLMSPLGPWLVPFMGRRSLARTFSRIFGKDSQPSPAEIDEFWSLIEHNAGKAVIPKLIPYMKERKIYARRWTDALVSAEVPLRLIDGAADPISGQHMAAYYRQKVPKPDVVLLHGIGHYPQIESPEQVLEHLIPFFDEQ